jgi:hypothetical protein
MNRPRKQTYTMDMYLNKIKDMDIRNDSDTQRQFVWTNEQINELIVTILTEDYIPPIILAEVDNSQLWIVDGGQRSSSFCQFRYGNYKITSAIENSIIPYKKKVKDEQGKIAWEDSEFDIKNKTFDKLPEELQKKFNEYQIETAIHEDCDARRIAQLIKRYNNHTSMNSNQKAFTYVDNYAREVRDILENVFFLECGTYTEKERSKGVLERVVLESVMAMFHFEDWKKQPKQIATWLNENATLEEFNIFKSNLDRLENIIFEDLRDLFSSKDSFIWFTLFHKFCELGMDDACFGEFLRAFKHGLKDRVIDEMSYSELDKNRGTKDKAVISSKLNLLTTLMYEFFGIDEASTIFDNVLSFVKENVNNEINKEDVELYEEILDCLTEDVDKIFVINNKPSLIGIVAYSCLSDIDLDDWLKNFLSKSNFSKNQKENYIYMKESLEEHTNVSA